MMNINCSEKCVYEQNGKCTLNHVTPLLSLSSHNKDCGYFIKKDSLSKTPSNI